MTTYHPDALLLLEGVNDLNNGVDHTPQRVQGVLTLIASAHKPRRPSVGRHAAAGNRR